MSATRPSARRAPSPGRLRAALLAEIDERLRGEEPTPSILLTVDAIVTAARRLESVREKLDEQGPIVTGSRKQLRPHPLLAVERQLEDAIARELERLGPATFRLRGSRTVRKLQDLTAGQL